MQLQLGKAYDLRLDAEHPEQRLLDGCHIGGVPKLEEDFKPPQCTICNSAMPFFLQMSFQRDHPWWGYSVASFFCVKCSPNTIWKDISKMLPPCDFRRDADLSEMLKQQTCFRFVISRQAKVKPNAQQASILTFTRILENLSENIYVGNHTSGGFFASENTGRRIYGNLNRAEFCHLYSHGTDFRQAFVKHDGTAFADGKTVFDLFDNSATFHLFGSLGAGDHVCYPHIEI
jgi:hypothetical protein